MADKTEYTAEDTLAAMKMGGVTLPRHPLGKMDSAIRVQDTLARLDGGFKVGSVKKEGMGDTSLVMPRYFDPRMSNQSGYPGMLFQMEDENQRKIIYDWCRLFYSTHPIVGACIDIYSRFPVVDAELRCKDNALTKFYHELFFEELEYEDFFIDLGKEYWTVGEAFPFGAWDEDLGVWVAEELLDPTNIEVKRMPLTGQSVYFLDPPDFMKELVRNRNPIEMFLEFEKQFGDLIPFIERGDKIPVSPDVLSHIARRDNRRAERGTPVLVRGFKTLLIEDRMEGAMQAVADRLYSPLLLFKLGVSDLGDGQPWIPSPTQIDSFKETLDAALSSEFRALVTHFGVEVEEAIPAKYMSSFKGDREMLNERLFQVFGLSSDLLSSSSGQPYASSALRIEFVNQILSSYQKFLTKHYESRARTVAEAQGHYDFERKGDKRIPIFEDYLEYNDETGEKVIKQRPKLLIPELHLQTMNFRDENTEREFLVGLRELGIPIADSDLMVGIPFDWEEARKRSRDETIERELTISEMHKAIYMAATEKGLPIPPATIAYMAEAAPTALGDETVPTEPGEASPADKELERERAKKELDAFDATDGGGRPNVSDNKKKDMPKAATTYKSSKDEEGEPILIEELPHPQAKLSISMIDASYESQEEGAGEADE